MPARLPGLSATSRPAIKKASPFRSSGPRGSGPERPQAGFCARPTAAPLPFETPRNAGCWSSQTSTNCCFPQFGFARSADTKTRFNLEGGGYRIASAIKSLMGEGGDFVVLDDPHSIDEAESDEVRDETVRKLELTLHTRIRSKTGAAVVIAQRLHERDYCGKLLE